MKKKKLIAIVLLLSLTLSVSGCGIHTTALKFPFAVEDIEIVDMYHYCLESAEKKEVSAQADIRNLYQMLEGTSLKVKKADEVYVHGAEITSFRFHLTDGTEYELAYFCCGVKNGFLQKSSDENWYFTSADIGACWESLNSELKAVPADEGEVVISVSQGADQTKSSDPSVDDEQCAAKPVIYLYPENEIDVSVKLDYSGKLTCSYPSYNDGWSVSACPDGTLTDTEGQSYNYLYWEGVDDIDYDFSEGFCIAGNETAAFLEDALNRLGLTRREANEFIVYWLPLMQESPYNLISFQSDVYTQAAKLTVDPAPDTLLRVFMAWKPLGSTVDIPVQDLNAVPRTGFTVVEWGGCQVK